MKDKLILLLNKTINNTNKNYALMQNIIQTEKINCPIEININTDFVKESFFFFWNNFNENNKYYFPDKIDNNILCFISELHININLLDELKNINIDIESRNKKEVEIIKKIKAYFKNKHSLSQGYDRKNIRIDSIIFIENLLGICEFKIWRNKNHNSSAIFTDVIRSLYIMNKNIKVNFSLIVCIDGDYLNNNSDYEQIFFSNKDIEIFKINTFLDDEYQQLSCKKIYNILENKIINQRNFIILINNKDVVSDEIKISKNHLSDNINLSISFLYDDICNKINELIKNLNLKSVLEDFKSNNDYYSSTNLFINYCNHRIQYHSILGFKVLYSKILEKKKIVNSDYFIDFLRNDYIKLNKNIFSSTEWHLQNSDSIFEEEEIYLKNLLENPDQFIGNSEFNEEAKNILKFKRIFNNITEDNNHNDFDELYLLVKDFSNHINNFFKKNLSENKKNKSPETLYRTNLFNKRSKAIILFIQLLFSKEEKDIKESILFINNYYSNIPNNTKIYKAIFLSLKIMCVSCIYFLSYKSFDINNITITINDMVQKNFITNEINNTFLSSSIIENEISNILSKEKYSIKKDTVFKAEISTLLSGELLKIMLGKMT